MASAEKTQVVHDLEELKPIETIDTVHNDEAVKVLATYGGEQGWTEQEEAKLRRKIDFKLVPVLCLTYGLQYYDKAMLGQAALFGIIKDLGLTGQRYSYTSAIFYLGFIAGSYPAMILAQRYPVERVASVIVTLWGLCLLLTSVCHNYQGIYAQRFFLGVLESGISPMFMLIVGSFYKKNEQALRIAAWYCCTAYVSCFSPLVNYGLGQINGGTHAWKYMYYFGGAITMVWGLLLYVLIPPDPIRVRGFNQRERYIMVARLRTNNSGVRNTHFKSEQVLELLLDPKFWLVFSIAMLSMFGNAPISTFLGIIIDSFGFTRLDSLLLIIPVGFWGGTAQLAFAYLAFKYQNIRSYLVFIGQIVLIFGCLLIWLLPRSDKGALMFAVIILPTLGAGYAILMGLALANVAGYTKRSLTSSGIFVGYCLGNFIGPLCYKASDAPRYAHGFIVVIITGAIAGVLALVYRFVCVRDNKARDAAGVMEGFDHAYEDDLTDKKNPQFRYIL